MVVVHTYEMGSVNTGAGVEVSIVSDYRLDDRDSIPGGGKGFSL
jgi:hypothetical protein